MLEAKLDESPDLLNYIQGTSPKRAPRVEQTFEPQSSVSSKEVDDLRAEVAALKEKIRRLEEENLVLQTKISSKPATPSPASPFPAAVAPIAQGNVDEWKSRAEQLEKENFELRKSLLVKRKTESGHSTSRTNLFATVEEADDEKTAAVVTPRTADPRELIRRRLSRSSHDAPDHSSISEEEHPDWVKKYSDQHKRAYWRNKVSVSLPTAVLIDVRSRARQVGHLPQWKELPQLLCQFVSLLSQWPRARRGRRASSSQPIFASQSIVSPPVGRQ
jgi:hypothetical protein